MELMRQSRLTSSFIFFVADASWRILLSVSEFPVVLNVRRVLAVLEPISSDGSGEFSPYGWPFVLQDQVVALHRERGLWKASAGIACYPEKPPLGTWLGTPSFSLLLAPWEVRAMSSCRM